MRRSRLLAGAVAALLAASCGVPRDSDPRAIAQDRVPFDLLDPRPAVTTTLPPR
jgi:hypothetical protein